MSFFFQQLQNQADHHQPSYSATLPLFQFTYREKTGHNEVEYRRVRTESIYALRMDLLNHNWKSVYEQTNVNKVYHLFLHTFKTLDGKHCPIKQYRFKSKYSVAGCPMVYKMLVKKTIICIKNVEIAERN